MTTSSGTASVSSSSSQSKADPPAKPEGQAEKILCPHCKRTASNGIKCLGICVADSDY